MTGRRNLAVLATVLSPVPALAGAQGITRFDSLEIKPLP
jgi:hypothetical protein